MNATKQSPIGVFDSGLGGISVLREAARLLPREDFLYYGDSANAPYGEKSPETVRELTEAALLHLLEKGCKAVVLACNTATSAAAEYLREKYPSLPILGIEPAVKPAAEQGGKILVLATPLTIREEKYKALVATLSETSAEICSLPCPGIPELVESGILSGKLMDELLDKLFAPLRGQHFDRVVLGCTHYPFVASSISKALGYPVPMIDGAYGTAHHLRDRLAEAELLREDWRGGRIAFENSDITRLPLMKKLFRGM